MMEIDMYMLILPAFFFLSNILIAIREYRKKRYIYALIASFLAGYIAGYILTIIL